MEMEDSRRLKTPEKLKGEVEFVHVWST
ncbi:hypothetical protein CCACVL1_19676 [Corchorus capsularis]|uniref:Uncharacterized protein n=1 Tax=Corchorus capsularis TaxID=210143 RepID=A0A1R3HFB9_COCAP|nr:hypothetical protein CCACVL1_19676 [Corchorus capsularis]